MTKRKAVIALLKGAIAARERIKEIDPVLAVQKEILRRACDAHIKVNGTTYPGTILTIAGAHLRVHDPIENRRFYYDRESDSVCSTAL